MGQGVLKDVSGRLVTSFAENLAAMLEGKEPAEAGAPARPTRDEATPAATAAAEGEDALDLGSLGGQLVSDQLRDPRRLGALLALVAALFSSPRAASGAAVTGQPGGWVNRRATGRPRRSRGSRSGAAAAGSAARLLQ